jgi:hypothetical protein
VTSFGGGSSALYHGRHDEMSAFEFVAPGMCLSMYSDSKNCPNVWHFWIVCDIASYAD